MQSTGSFVLPALIFSVSVMKDHKFITRNIQQPKEIATEIAVGKFSFKALIMQERNASKFSCALGQITIKFVVQFFFRCSSGPF